MVISFPTLWPAAAASVAYETEYITYDITKHGVNTFVWKRYNQGMLANKTHLESIYICICCMLVYTLYMHIHVHVHVHVHN